MSCVITLILAVTITVVSVLYVMSITYKNRVQEAMADVDVQLKKRYDLIPNMLNMSTKFMEHRKTLMTKLTDLRTRAMQNNFSDSPKTKMELKNLVEIFPSNLIAKRLNITYKDTPFFEAGEVERKPVNSQDYFK